MKSATMKKINCQKKQSELFIIILLLAGKDLLASKKLSHQIRYLTLISSEFVRKSNLQEICKAINFH